MKTGPDIEPTSAPQKVQKWQSWRDAYSLEEFAELHLTVFSYLQLRITSTSFFTTTTAISMHYGYGCKLLHTGGEISGNTNSHHNYYFIFSVVERCCFMDLLLLLIHGQRGNLFTLAHLPFFILGEWERSIFGLTIILILFSDRILFFPVCSLWRKWLVVSFDVCAVCTSIIYITFLVIGGD